MWWTIIASLKKKKLGEFSSASVSSWPELVRSVRQGSLKNIRVSFTDVLLMFFWEYRLRTVVTWVTRGLKIRGPLTFSNPTALIPPLKTEARAAWKSRCCSRPTSTGPQGSVPTLWWTKIVSIGHERKLNNVKGNAELTSLPGEEAENGLLLRIVSLELPRIQLCWQRGWNEFLRIFQEYL